MKREILLIISILLSITAISVSVLRCSPISFDYMGVLVGILSLLVTALLGWNIYALIDMRGVKDLLEAQIDVLRRDVYLENKRSVLMIFQSMAEIFQKTKDVNSALYYNILSIRCAIESQQLHIADQLIDLITEDEYCLYEETKELLLNTLYKSKELYSERGEDIERIIQIVRDARNASLSAAGA